MLIVCCLVILVWDSSCVMGQGVHRWHELTMTRTYLGPKLSSMRFRYSYSRGMRLSTCDLSSIQLIFALTLTLTIQDAYDRGNES